MDLGNYPMNSKINYLTTKKGRERNKKKWKKMSMIRKKAKQLVDTQHIKKDNKCALCGYCFKLAFHHTNYEKNEGFTVCYTCHKRYCKEGRSYKDSLRLYEEREQRAVVCFHQKAMPVSH